LEGKGRRAKEYKRRGKLFEEDFKGEGGEGRVKEERRGKLSEEELGKKEGELKRIGEESY